ncbi:MAG: hypothetical protein AAF441_23260 [Pseudomonadota bacterium]
MADTEHADVTRDSQDRIRRIDHSAEPVAVTGASSASSVASVAARYLRKQFKFENVRARSLRDNERAKQKDANEGIVSLRTDDVKDIRGLMVVEFNQYYDGIPVWSSGAAVLLEANTRRVIEASSTYDHEIPRIRFKAADLDRHTKELSEKMLPDLLALDENRRRLNIIRDNITERRLPLEARLLDAKPEFRITKKLQVIYLFDPHQRAHRPHGDDNADRNLVERALDLVLPSVAEEIKPGAHRLATEVFFTTSGGGVSLNWRMIVDQKTNSVLRLRPLMDNMVTGYIYDRDPLTTTGDTSIVPSSPTAVLNGPRTPRPLPTAVAPNLTGQYVDIQDVMPIPAPPPTSAVGKFDYDANTDDFSAVNAYYHNDAVFRMVEEMGFNMSSYFDGTPFPVPVDHRGSSACVNAAAWATASSDGLQRLTYGLVEANQPMGIATDVRVVLHEFGHAILFDNVSSGNLGFAHSCGDSLAAVLCDPGSRAPDRFLTFPWITGIPRRHDRDVAAGWAWGGANDLGGYDSEQILATSHFRAYRSIGGDHPDLCEQEWAARYIAYLMIHAVGSFTPATNPGSAEAWSDRLQLCDRITDLLEGHPGGAVHKVVRWAFELQGAYQPATAPSPVVTRGAPPRFDIYINDGRNGEYDFTLDWCHTKDIWNRICPDGYPAHQPPIPGIENHVYVMVRNRGTEKTFGGSVRAFHKRDDGCCDCCDDCAELTWPDDFKPMITERLAFPPIAPGDYAMIGPFVWKPKRGDCILMSAEVRGDRSNISLIAPGQSLLTRRLVPFDNNLALRCICKQCNPDYSKLMLKHPCPEHKHVEQ